MTLLLVSATVHKPFARDRREGQVAVSMGKVFKPYLSSTCQKMCSCRFAWQHGTL